jgi:hypothetical protein
MLETRNGYSICHAKSHFSCLDRKKKYEDLMEIQKTATEKKILVLSKLVESEETR